MLGQPAKGEIRLKCTEAALAEFPQILFGTDEASNKTYFDATSYLQQLSPSRPLTHFWNQYRPQILALCNAYHIAAEDVCKINEEGHSLIDGNFVYLFISFVEPDFLAYMCDRTHEILTQGISVSDTYLFQSVRNRLSSEVLKQIIENERNTE